MPYLELTTRLNLAELPEPTGVSMKFENRHTETILKGAGHYHRLKTSSIHDLYRRVAEKEWILARDRQTDFYRRPS